MYLHELVDTSARVAQTRRRGEKVSLLAACIARIAPPQVPAGVAFLAGEVRQGKVGVGPAQLRRLAVPAADRPSLTLAELDAALESLSTLAGAGSARRRTQCLEALLARCTASEQSFVIRLLAGELRQGALESLVLEAVARAAGTDAALVRRAWMLAADRGAVAQAALTGGDAALAAFDLTVMRPVQPMLAGAAQDLDDALSRIGDPVFEHKLDGARVQVHKARGDVRVFTRRLNDVTAAVPELVEAVAALPARSLILDGETLALDRDGRPLPFQVTMRRFGRRLDVERLRGELPLTTVFFDCLLLDGQSLLDAEGGERWRALRAALGAGDGADRGRVAGGGSPPVVPVPRLASADRGAASRFVARAFEAGHEGVMVKSLGASYAAGSRGAAWLKLKQVHTLDLVVLAVEQGSGRRSRWLSNLHLGARDPASGGFVMLGKTFKGMTDRMLAWQTERLQALALERDGHTLRVRPELVVEVAFNDVQQSPHYPGGLALRFARVKRYRDDKSAAEADTVDTVRAIHAGATNGARANPRR